MPCAKRIINDISYSDSAYNAAEGVDALLILTEWKEFSEIDLLKLRNLIKTPIIFDGRNMYKPSMMDKEGFEYYCVGKVNKNQNKGVVKIIK